MCAGLRRRGRVTFHYRTDQITREQAAATRPRGRPRPASGTYRNLLTVAQAAERLGVTTARVRLLYAYHVLEATKVRGRTLLGRAEVEALAASGRAMAPILRPGLGSVRDHVGVAVPLEDRQGVAVERGRGIVYGWER